MAEWFRGVVFIFKLHMLSFVPSRTLPWHFVISQLAPVVQKVDIAVHWINHYPADKCDKTYYWYAIHRIVICPVETHRA